MIVKDLYMDCFRYDESSLAHYIYHLLAEKKISLDDDMSKIDLEQEDHQKVKELIQAMQFFTKTFHQNPLNCHEYSLDYQLTRGNDVISFRDMRKEFMSFPTIAGYFKR
jgi:hypothetical protein